MKMIIKSYPVNMSNGIGAIAMMSTLYEIHYLSTSSASPLCQRTRLLLISAYVWVQISWTAQTLTRASNAPQGRLESLTRQS